MWLGPDLHAIHVLIQMIGIFSLSQSPRKTLGNVRSKMADDRRGNKYGDPRPTEFRTKLNFILSFCLNKIKIAELLASAFFLVKIKVTVESPDLPAAARVLSAGPVVFFSRLSGVRGRVLSSQLRLSEAETLSVLELQNSKSWSTRNLVS